MNSIENKIAEYVNILCDSLDKTTHANDRLTYTKHLAEAARWFGMINRGVSKEKLRKQILQEERNFGWGFLSGSEGESVEKAFAELVKYFK